MPQKRVFLIPFILLFLLFHVSVSWAGVIEPGLFAALDTAGAQEKISVILTLIDKVDLGSIHGIGKAILSQEEFQRLLSDLERTEHPDQCPHGRPTRIFLSLDDLKKMFKRK